MTDNKNNMSKSYILFQVFKYTIYGILFYDLYLFFIDNLQTSETIFAGDVGLVDYLTVFSDSIDSSAWLILVIIFELETFIMSDEKLLGFTQWILFLAKAICYFFILYAFYGFVDKLSVLLHTTAFKIDDVCQLVNSQYSYLVSLDDYQPINNTVCKLLNNQPLVQINGSNIIATQQALIEAQRLAWVDIINSADWILVVIILEVDVYLQLRGKLTGKIRKISTMIKPPLYGILFIDAIYWGIKGGPIDFWDAFLWLAAFFFIEMNIFEWHNETESERDTMPNESN